MLAAKLVKFVPKLMANPALVVEMAPVLVVVGAVAAAEYIKEEIEHKKNAKYEKKN